MMLLHSLNPQNTHFPLNASSSQDSWLVALYYIVNCCACFKLHLFYYRAACNADAV